MDDFLKDILKKQVEFKEYLLSIDINEFNKYSRAELKEFNELLRKNSGIRSLWCEIDKINEKKKLEEFPELLGVHHYPEIKELNYISEEDKIKLDNYLAGLRLHSYIYKGSCAFNNLFKNWNKDIENKIFLFLEQKGIIQQNYKLYCEHDDCNESTILTQEDIDNYLWYFDIKNNKKYSMLSDNEKDKYEQISYDLDDLVCWECGYEIEIDEDTIKEIVDNPNKNLYKLIKDIDTFYDDK